MMNIKYQQGLSYELLARDYLDNTQQPVTCFVMAFVSWLRGPYQVVLVLNLISRQARKYRSRQRDLLAGDSQLRRLS